MTERHSGELGGRRFDVVLLNLPAPGKDQDAWLLQDGFVGLADGATPLSADDPGVRSFADEALKRLAAGGSGRGSRPAPETFAAAIRQVGWQGPTNWELPSCTVGLLRDHDGAVEVAVLGDCLVVAALAGGRHRLVRDERLPALDHQAELRLRELLERDGSVEQALEAIQPVLRANRQRMNRDDSYWAFANDPAAAEHVMTARLDPREVEAVLLCTDGFTRLWETFAVVDSPLALLRRAMEDGLDTLGERLRALERAPGSMRRHPRFAVHDDATAILVRPSARG